MPSETRFVSVKCYSAVYKLNYGVPTVRTLINKKSLARLLSRKKAKVTLK